MKHFSSPLFTVLIIYCCFIFNGYWVIHSTFSSKNIISLSNISIDNICQRLLIDLILCLPIILILNIFFIKSKEIFKINKSCLFCFCLLTFSFFVCHDYSIRGIYIFFYSIFLISLSEELLFRGYMYPTLKKVNLIFSFFLTGCLFGISHIIVPSIMYEWSLPKIIYNIIPLIGWGIYHNSILIYLYIKSNTLFVPITFHGLTNYFSEYGYIRIVYIIRFSFLCYYLFKDIYTNRKKIIVFFTKPHDYF